MNDTFYYMAGRCMGFYYGDESMEFRKLVVSKFKEWVDFKIGSDNLPNDQAKVNAIVKQFVYEFKRGESRGRQRH